MTPYQAFLGGSLTIRNISTRLPRLPKTSLASTFPGIRFWEMGREGRGADEAKKERSLYARENVEHVEPPRSDSPEIFAEIFPPCAFVLPQVGVGRDAQLLEDVL